MNKKLIKLYTHHSKTILTIAILFIFLGVAVFLYNNVFWTLQNVTQLYGLKSEANFSTINTDAFDQAYDNLQEKHNYSININNISSPF